MLFLQWFESYTSYFYSVITPKTPCSSIMHFIASKEQSFPIVMNKGLTFDASIRDTCKEQHIKKTLEFGKIV